jgi:monofunctional biosynthetic peptidoglycan transglycosylase
VIKRLLLVLALVIGGGVAWLFAVWPPPLWYRTHWPRETAFMSRPLPVQSIGAALAARPRMYQPVPLDSITPRMQDAVMVGEDDAFLTHHGIDYLSLARALGYKRATLDWSSPRDREALKAVLPQAWARRDKLRGASTITQQLAKNLYLSPSRNPLRKVKEAVTAYRLELALGKPRIMELYLNVIELGPNLFGVEAASQLYFKRSARSISTEQAAALAGSLPFPLRSNPATKPGRMRWRQNLILRRLRGEEVEVPKQEAEDEIVVPVPVTVDSLAVPPIDTTAWPVVPVDTVPYEAPPDTVPAPDPIPPDTGAVPQ